MTVDTNPSPTTQTAPTPLAIALGSESLTPRFGALTPVRFSDAATEWTAMQRTETVHDLGWLRRIEARGEDRFRWLNGMVTNAVTGLAAQTGAWNLVLNAQGRILGDLHVWREGDGSDSDRLFIEVTAEQQEKLLTHLDRFIIMDDVELVPVSELSALGVTLREPSFFDKLGITLDESLRQETSFASQTVQWNGQPLLIEHLPGSKADHYQLWTAQEKIPALFEALKTAGAVPVGAETLETLRVVEAVPTYGVDFVERDLPQETGQMQTLHFSKGCYQGQEIVERIRSRGNVHRHLRHLTLDGPLPTAGTELFYAKADGSNAPAGQITSAVELPDGSRIALGVVRAEAEIRKQPIAYIVNEVRGNATVIPATPAHNV